MLSAVFSHPLTAYCPYAYQRDNNDGMATGCAAYEEATYVRDVGNA